jgi:hypothetical protein
VVAAGIPSAFRISFTTSINVSCLG